MQDDNLKHGPYFANAVFKGSKKLPQKQEKNNGESSHRMKHSDGQRQPGRPSSRSRPADNQRSWMYNNRPAYPTSYQQWAPQAAAYSADAMSNFSESMRNAAPDNPRGVRSSSSQRSQGKRSSRHTSNANAQYGSAGHNGQQPRKAYTSQQRHSNQYGYAGAPAQYEPYSGHYEQPAAQPPPPPPPHWPSAYNPNGLPEQYANNVPPDYYGQPGGYNHGYNAASTFGRYKHGADASRSRESRQRSTSRPPSNTAHHSSDESNSRGDTRNSADMVTEPQAHRGDAEVVFAPSAPMDYDASQSRPDAHGADKPAWAGDQGHVNRRRPTLEPYERPDDAADDKPDDAVDDETNGKTDSNSAEGPAAAASMTDIAAAQPEMQQSSQNIVHDAQAPNDADNCDLEPEADERTLDLAATSDESYMTSFASELEVSHGELFAKETEPTPNGIEDISSDADEYFECSEYHAEDVNATVAPVVSADACAEAQPEETSPETATLSSSSENFVDCSDAAEGPLDYSKCEATAGADSMASAVQQATGDAEADRSATSVEPTVEAPSPICDASDEQLPADAESGGAQLASSHISHGIIRIPATVSMHQPRNKTRDASRSKATTAATSDPDSGAPECAAEVERVPAIDDDTPAEAKRSAHDTHQPKRHSSRGRKSRKPKQIDNLASGHSGKKPQPAAVPADGPTFFQYPEIDAIHFPQAVPDEESAQVDVDVVAVSPSTADALSSAQCTRSDFIAVTHNANMNEAIVAAIEHGRLRGADGRSSGEPSAIDLTESCASLDPPRPNDYPMDTIAARHDEPMNLVKSVRKAKRIDRAEAAIVPDAYAVECDEPMDIVESTQKLDLGPADMNDACPDTTLAGSAPLAMQVENVADSPPADASAPTERNSPAPADIDVTMPTVDQSMSDVESALVDSNYASSAPQEDGTHTEDVHMTDAAADCRQLDQSPQHLANDTSPAASTGHAHLADAMRSDPPSPDHAAIIATESRDAQPSRTMPGSEPVVSSSEQLANADEIPSSDSVDLPSMDVVVDAGDSDFVALAADSNVSSTEASHNDGIRTPASHAATVSLSSSTSIEVTPEEPRQKRRRLEYSAEVSANSGATTNSTVPVPNDSTGQEAAKQCEGSANAEQPGTSAPAERTSAAGATESDAVGSANTGPSSESSRNSSPEPLHGSKSLDRSPADDIDDISQDDRMMALETSRRSQVIQRGLPRPFIIQERDAPASTTDVQLADDLVRHEMLAMLQFDAIMDAVPAPEHVSVDKPDTLEKFIANYAHEDFTDTELADARQLLANEMEAMKGERGHGPVALSTFTEVWDEWLPAFSYSPGQKMQDNDLNKDYRIALAKKTFHQNRKSCGLKRSECKKKELSVQEETFGFRVRAEMLCKRLHRISKKVEEEEEQLKRANEAEMETKLSNENQKFERLLAEYNQVDATLHSLDPSIKPRPIQHDTQLDFD